ncbi:Bypass of stop codon protein 6 [Rhizoctonia solani AG-1 IB]|uniref:Bypass of stop codon protein 6 n=1 Tax=Thanatephorus cucumeris (strain AG1-IB / isolate 7/3/14) TaxID=1108050 RepID=M5BYH8_THACB|nr:Bypass of stop codon protein 6 [Rhizoctonia solani AG-1 IB]
MAHSLSELPPNVSELSNTIFCKPAESDSGMPIQPSTCHPQLRGNQDASETGTLGGDAPKRNTLSLDTESPGWTMDTKQEWIAIAACCWSVFSVGWNDATTGPLLPAFQAHYKINFTVVSMLFVSNCVGFLSAAVINIRLTDQLGLGKIMFLGAVLQVMAYSLLAPALPFPVMCIAYAINGLGVGFQDAQANGFIAGIPNKSSEKMGLLHAVYGAGAFISPLVATQFSQLTRWSFHYLISLGLAVINMIVLLVVFRLRKEYEITGLPDPKHAQSSIENDGTHRSGNNKYREILGSRTVQLMAFFIWVYVGLEVTIGGWIVTFIIDERGGGPSAGYISSGFFGGLMLGRVALLWVNQKVLASMKQNVWKEF